MKIKHVTYHYALAGYCILIFILSSIPGDNFPKVEFDLSDKIVHIIIYGVLFVLFFYSLKYQNKYITLHKYSPEFALLFTVLYGVTDEIHQYFVPLRSCEFADWVADVIGSLIAYTILKLNLMRRGNITAAILIMFLAGCTTSENVYNTAKSEIKITGAEAWLDLMPGAGEDANIFRFYINLAADKRKSGEKFEITDFKIFLNTDTLSGKRFKTEFSEVNEGSINLSIYPSEEEMYVSKSDKAPSTAIFTFNIVRSDGYKKKIRTSKLNINKVY